MKHILTLIALSFTFFVNSQCVHQSISRSVQNSVDALRSDTFDIVHTRLEMDLTDVEGDDISVMADMTVQTKMSSINYFPFDLKSLTIDSVVFNNEAKNYQYDQEDIYILLDSNLIAFQDYHIYIYYHGQPVSDPSGWGGWYTGGGYTYNLGVAFEDDPHSYGRIWHPCFDNFVERSTYEFITLTANGNTSYCSGIRTALDSLEGDTLQTTWELNQTIPSYLASVSVANYVHSEDEFVSITGDTIPIWLTSIPGDSTNMKNSFVNLKLCLETFENAFGPYKWDRVGYHMVPFNGGAMEHAANISYPRYAIAGGTLQYETLMAHELAHHWFGNLVTCSSDEEMWINEGVASYAAALFIEEAYGEEAYKDYIKSNHFGVVTAAHISDNGYLTLAEMPHESSYGSTTYNKGEAIMHTMRSYASDSLFYKGLKDVLEAYSFDDVSSEEFRDKMNEDANIDMTDFFDDWIFQPGFIALRIDSFEIISTNPVSVEVHVSQHVKAKQNLYSNVPFEITAISENKEVEHFAFTLNSANASFTINPSFEPQMITCDLNEKITQALTSDSLTVTSTGAKILGHTDIEMVVIETGGDDFIRVESFWLAPTEIDSDNNTIVNASRYWKVDGILSDEFEANFKIIFDGREGVGSHYDDSLMVHLDTYDETDLKVLFREHPGVEWRYFNRADLNTVGTATPGFGFFFVNDIKKGEYVLGFEDGTAGSQSIDQSIRLMPNPAHDILFINDLNDHIMISLISSDGKLSFHQYYSETGLDLTGINSGIYTIQYKLGEKSYSGKFVKQ
jgi:hypothetical protein